MQMKALVLGAQKEIEEPVFFCGEFQLNFWDDGYAILRTVEERAEILSSLVLSSLHVL